MTSDIRAYIWKLQTIFIVAQLWETHKTSLQDHIVDLMREIVRPTLEQVFEVVDVTGEIGSHDV